MDLADFLRSRLDEDERLATAQQESIDTFAAMRNPGDVDAVHVMPFDLDGAPGDPARVLREVAAKRAILDAVDRYLNPHPGRTCTNLDDDGEPLHEPCDLHVARMATAVKPYALVLLASVYSDHPDYRAEWAPETASVEG